MNRLVGSPDRSLHGSEKIIVFSIFAILLLRLFAVDIMGLMPQDAYYYYVYGEHLSLSYFDHPPLIGYLLRISTEIFGKTVIAIKLADTLVTAATVYAFYRLSLYFLGTYRARRALLLLFSTFMVTILSLVSTPDVPLMLFWSLSLIMLYKAIFLEKQIYWLWSGLMMGLSFDSKYTGILLPAGLVLFFLVSGTHRKKLLSRGFWLSVVIFIITILPVMIWNARNHFVSFRFQSEDRAESIQGLHFTPLNVAGLIGHQSAILTPVLFFALVYFLFRILKRYVRGKKNISDRSLFLLCFFVPGFLGFVAISLVYWVKLNWLMPVYLTGIILAAKYISMKWVKYQVIFSLVIHVALAVEIFFYPVQVKSDDTWFGWKTLAKDVEKIHHGNPSAFVFSADGNKTSSILNFYSDSVVYSQNVIGENALHFDYIGQNLHALEGKNAYFINSVPNFSNDARENKYPESLKLYFDSITELDPILIRNESKTMRKFLVFYCTNYHPDKIHSLTTRVN